MQEDSSLDTKVAYATEVCNKYNRIKADGKRAEAEWKNNLGKAEEAKYPKEKEMYEEYAECALAGFKASIEWLKTVDRAMRTVSSYEVQCILTQHFVEGIPLKAIVGKRGKYMSQTTATKYKKIGIVEFANNIYCSKAHLEKMESVLEKSL